MKTRKGTPYVAGDGSRLKRALGLRNCNASSKIGGYDYMLRTMSYEQAVKVAEAIGVDPVDVGL